MAIVTPHWILDIFFLANIIFFILHLYMKRKHRYWEKRGVATAGGTDIYGNLKECIWAKKPLRDVLGKFYSQGENEKAIGFYVFTKPFLILRDPELIKSILVRDFKNFSNRCMAPIDSDYIGTTNIFSLKNPMWKILRHKLSPVFTLSKLKSTFDSILGTVSDMDMYLNNLITDDKWKIVDVKDLCEKFTTDVIGSAMFGMKLNALNDSNSEFRKEGKKHFDNSYKRHISLLSLFFMPWLARLLRLTFFDPDVPLFFKKVLPKVMAERITSGVKRNDLLDAFIDLKNSYEDESDELHYYFKEEGLIATSIVFFTGGFEPSASMMYFTLYELAKNPEIQQKLRSEIVESMEQNDGKITYDMVTTLPFLEMVSAEALRKYPLLHFLDREAEEDYQLPDSNIIIEKGTPIIIPLSGLHMNPKYYPDPETFDPERFSPENKRRIPSFAYIPFGEGPRNCIGMRIGLTQSKIGLMHIISKYEIAVCEETPIPLEFDSYTLFTKSKHNMKLNMRRLNM